MMKPLKKKETVEATEELTKEEKAHLESEEVVEEEKEDLNLSLDRQSKIIAVIKEKLGMSGNFNVIGMSDKGSNVGLTFSNTNFEVSVKIKNVDLINEVFK